MRSVRVFEFSIFMGALLFLTAGSYAGQLKSGTKQHFPTQFRLWAFDQSPYFLEIVGIQNAVYYNAARDFSSARCMDANGNALRVPGEFKKLKVNPAAGTVEFVIDRWDQGNCNFWFESGQFDLILKSKIDGRVVRIRVLIEQFFHARRVIKSYDLLLSESIGRGREEKLSIVVDAVEPVLNIL